MRKNFIPLLIFLVTFVIAVFSVISVIFPALILRVLGGFEDYAKINPFELGVWAYPFLIVNLSILVFGIAYYKKILPKSITSTIKFIQNFEVSPQLAFVIITVLIGFYIIFSVGELFNNIFEADYNERVKTNLENFDFIDNITSGEIEAYGNYFLGVISIKIFGNYKVIPFITSILLLIVTYFLTKQITKKRFSGIISMCIVLQSGIFSLYDTGITYPNFWILFYLISLYAVLKMAVFSPIFFLFGILSKALTLAFLPMSLFFVYRSNISKKKKISIVISYVIILVVFILGSFIFGSESVTGKSDISMHDFWGGFTVFNSSFQHDAFILIFLLPLIVCLFIASRKGISHADSIMFMIMGLLLSAPLLTGVSTFINAPYRFIPLVVFFAIGVGIIISKPNPINTR